MKLFIFATLITHISSAYVRSEEHYTSDSEWRVGMLQRIEVLKKQKDDASIKRLSEIVFKLNLPRHKERCERPVFDAARDALVSIPGHAENARQEIEKARLSLGSLIYEEGYSDTRRLQFETLSHLPSPETIKVLGDYLADDRDLAKEPVFFPDTGLAGLDANSWWSVRTLGRIGLRATKFPPPDVGKRPRFEDYALRDEAWRDIWHYEYDKRRKELDPWRAWYAEIKSGQRSFSFKGQSEEYRFKPDGTWETIPIANPPDDAPEVPEARPASGGTATQQLKEQPQENTDKAFRPYLLAALVGLLALAAAWFGMRRMKPRA